MSVFENEIILEIRGLTRFFLPFGSIVSVEIRDMCMLTSLCIKWVTSIDELTRIINK